MEAENNHLNAGNFKHGGSGTKEPPEKKRKRQFREEGQLGNDCQLATEDNSNFAEQLSKIREEVDAVKTENKLLVTKVDWLQAQNAELQAKLKDVESEAKLAAEQMAKVIEAKMTDKLEKRIEELEIALTSDMLGGFNAVTHECQRKFSELEREVKMPDKIAAPVSQAALNKTLETERDNLAALKESEKNVKHTLEMEQKLLKELQEEVTRSKELKQKKEDEFNQVSNEITAANCDHFDTERNRRQHEAVENLKRVFPERVFGRLSELCTPSHRKYQLSVTKVLGKHMLSIICVNEETVRECIDYLKAQHYPPEVFLPLTTLRIEPIREHLRDMKNPHGIKLLFEVISVPNNDVNIRKALQFVCGNSLVCDTAEHARQIAYGILTPGERYRAVALDGTQFQPNGVVSGKSSDLKAKAKKWEENAIRKLKEKRNQLQDELKQLHLTAKKELDVEMKRNLIRQLENRVVFTQQEIKKCEARIGQES